MNVIEVDNLFKAYDGVTVLRGLNLQIESGQVYGLLGPNGSGKSTLLHLLLGFLKPERGMVRVLGSPDLEQARSRVGYLPERLRYHLRYTGREYLRYLGQFSGIGRAQLHSRIEEELRAVGLADVADRLLSTYSRGMLQRLGIAQALLSDPDLLLIDEPTSGLDPVGQRELIGLLTEMRGRGHTILLTTHFTEEVDGLCDRAGILFGGQIAAEVEVAKLRGPGRNVQITAGHLPDSLALQLQRLAPAVRYSGGTITLQPNTHALQAQVIRALLDADVPIVAVTPQAPPLEDLYMRIVRGEAPDLSGLGPEPAPARPASTAGQAPDDADHRLFAPPGHPDRRAAEDYPSSETLVLPETRAAEDRPPESPAPGRPRPGDTLLRELLTREDQRDES
jgi:ABC-2 type transport system ATP-binding protein